MKKQTLGYVGVAALAGSFLFLAAAEIHLATPTEASHVEAGVAAVLDHTPDNTDASSMEAILAAVNTEPVKAEAPEETVVTEEAAPAVPVINGYTNLGIANVDTYLNVRKEPSEGSGLAGKMPQSAGCEILEALDGWYKVQSGEVSGYVKAEYLLTGDAAAIKAEEKLTNMATANTSNLNVRSQPSTESGVIIKIDKGEKLEVVEQLDGWVKVNVDSDEGYVSAEYVTVAMELPTAVTLKELSYGNGVSEKRVDIVQYAKQFLGNPYVWGGTSLTKGTDCSGFTMSIYKQFGVSLPHSSRAQANCGTKVSLSEARPGDLVFYGSGKGINHVAMYIGNGQVIHASTKKTGIKISNVSYRSVKTVRRIINE